MAMFVDVGHEGWMTAGEIRAEILRYDPGLDVRTRDTPGDPGEVTMMAVSTLKPDLPGMFANLALVQKLGAGVETIVNHPALPPQVRVARLKPDAPADEIAEFCLAYVLRLQRNMDAHDAAQENCSWEPIEPREAAKTVIGVLGLGHIGGRVARLFHDLKFQVRGWSRSEKFIDGVECVHGADALAPMLGQCDHVCAILPSTAATTGLFDADLLSAMKPGSTLINVGRGNLIDEAALLAALDAGRPGRAVLDVVSTEPLPPGNPLWTHPDVIVTPHVSGWHLGDAFRDVAENYRRLAAGRPLLHEVDRARGY